MSFGKRRAAKRERAAEKARKAEVAAAKARKKAERERYWTDAFERAEQGDTDAQDEICRKWPDSLFLAGLPNHLRPRYPAVKALYRARREEADLSILLVAWRAATNPKEEVETLARLFAFNWLSEKAMVRLQRKFEISWDELHERLRAAAQDRYEELLSQREDPAAFAELWKFINRSRMSRFYGRLYDYDFRKVGVADLPFPDDWNDLLARHYDTPALGAFRDVPERGSGDVRLLADQAPWKPTTSPTPRSRWLTATGVVTTGRRSATC